MARNEEKMQRKIQEIKEECRNENLQFHYIVADLGKMKALE